MRLEDLCLTFEYAPGSSVFGFHGVDLLDSGSEAASELSSASSSSETPVVSMTNLEEYLRLTLDFALHKGIKRQMDAMR